MSAHLIAYIASEIRSQVEQGIASHSASGGVWRAVFRGPPMELLTQVFEALIAPDGDASKGPGVPVLLYVDSGADNPPAGCSGRADVDHLVALRNSSDSPKFVTLVPPGAHTNLSFASASGSFGLSAANNTAASDITDWWKDDFIQSLVEESLKRMGLSSDAEREDARSLIEHAVYASDIGERHDVARLGAWRVLARTFEVEAGPRATERLSLACGFPPTSDGKLAAKEQRRILQRLAEHFESHGFRQGIEVLRADIDPADVSALAGGVAHVQGSAEIASTFAESPSYHYAPAKGDVLLDAPDWWKHLTVERLTEILEEERQPEGSLVVQCANAIFTPFKGGHAVVRDSVELEVRLPAGATAAEGSLTRQVGGRANTRTWSLDLSRPCAIVDEKLPAHSAPARYSAEAPELRKSTIKVISLATFEPGFFVHCPSARKTSAPRSPRRGQGNASIECTLTVEGNGRHYVTLYANPRVIFASEARRHEEGNEPGGTAVAVTRVGESDWGFEAEVTGDCHYDLILTLGDSGPLKVRIFLVGEDVAAEGARTEFERLIRLNRQQDRRATADVQIDRNVRHAHLQSWLLEKELVSKSAYPVVISSDYATAWSPPDWANPAKAIFSSGRFLNDPRPPAVSFQPPVAFVEARAAIAERIRGKDQHGLVEAAPLGQLLAGDPEFPGLLHRYVQSYLTWLEASPETAVWVDIVAFCRLEEDGATLRQEPEAIIVNPLHPVRLAWQAVAQRILFQAYQLNKPCPAAGILDPDSIPDVLHLPLMSADGSVSYHPYLAVECSSDYWGVLWNGKRLDTIAMHAETPPFHAEFGVCIGGISSGFSLAQVRRALDDVTEMACAKPVLTIAISSASGHTSACNEGIVSWAKERLVGGTTPAGAGRRILRVLDLRKEEARPQDAEISNLAEDTGNAVRWFGGRDDATRADLGIIAQLQASNPRASDVESNSPLSWGGMLRHRIRRQLAGGDGAFLSESRVGIAPPPSGDALADQVVTCLAKLERMGNLREGYVFAPSVIAIRQTLGQADFAAVSSAAVDPACFLGNWLPGNYLWDYDLPSYSHRAGDTNGYYLISSVKDSDVELIQRTLEKLPGLEKLSSDQVRAIVLEVARRGIPTVRGLSTGNSGATGDLGLFVAARLLQDGFRANGQDTSGILPVLREDPDGVTVALIIPVDPFRGYLEDLQRALGTSQCQRPDLLVVGIEQRGTRCRMRLTPVEVKYRGDPMSAASAREALSQASSLSALFKQLQERAQQPDSQIWKLAFEHLVTSMVSFAFRVYSHQKLAAAQSRKWSNLHASVVAALLGGECALELDVNGRLIILDRQPSSMPKDYDGDGFQESMHVSPRDAASILAEEAPAFYAAARERLGTWYLLPGSHDEAKDVAPPPEPASMPAQPGLRPNLAPTALVSGTPLVPPAASGARLASPQSAANPDIGIRFAVGDTIDGFRREPRFYHPSDTNLTHLNMGVVGDLGTGKTQLLKALLYHLSQGGPQNRGVRPRILIFDYKKDYSAPDFVQAVGAKVVKPRHLPFNLFDLRNSPESLTPWLDRFNFFSDTLDKIYAGIGPVQRSQLKSAVRAAYEVAKGNGNQPTIYDVAAQYKAIVDKPDSPSAILEDLVDREIFHPRPESAGSFASFLDGIVVVDLGSLGQDDRAKNMVVVTMLNLFYEHMLTLPKRPFIGTEPQLRVIDSLLLVDEADNIMRYEFDVLRKVLLQGREFGVGVILASQYLRHFKAGATDYRDPLLTWFIHKVPNVTPAELQGLGLVGPAAEHAERIKVLEKHCCLYKGYGVPGEVIEAVPFYKLASSSA